MPNVDGTITGATLLTKSSSGIDERETWLVTADFAAVAESSDVARLLDVGAAIDARARDGKSRTVRYAGPAFAGQETADGDPAYFLGTDGFALSVASDDLSGDLGTATTVADRTACTGVGVLVVCDAS